MDPSMIATAARFVFAAAMSVAFATGASAQMDPLNEAILMAIEHDDGSGLGDRGDDKLLEVFIHYENHDFAPIWVTPKGVAPTAEQLLGVLERSHEDALFPGDYGVNELRDLLNARDPDSLARLEVLLSKALVLHASHLAAGRTEPNRINPELIVFPAGPDTRVVLDGARSAPDIGLYARSFAPTTRNYVRLKFKLAEYRALAAAGGWDRLPVGKALRPGMRDDRVVPALRVRLERSGDLVPGSHQGDVLDGELVEAVKRFQSRHGSEPDGVVGPATVTDLNVSAADRVRQIEINMERRRWMADDLGARHIFINLADQYLKFVQGPDTEHVARIVVGQKFSRTPVFTSDMTYLVVSPYWNIPRQVAVERFLPELQRNAKLVSDRKIRVFSGLTEVSPFAIDWNDYTPDNFPFRLRQDPGPDNELGQIEFEFPNDFGINLHDTPKKHLFERASRAVGDAAILVEKPFDLAELLVGGQGWTRDKLDRLAATNAKRIIKLSRPVPVHVTYLTAWANKDGSMHFRRDIYERDRILSAALARYVPN